MALEGNWRPRAFNEMRGMDRRTFLGVSGASAAAVIFGAGPFTERAAAQPKTSGTMFTLGVASGEPLPGGVVIWTRLAPEPLEGGGMPDRKVPVRWEVAEDENFRKVTRRGTAFARPELGHSVHVEVEGLSPAREYFYRFRAGPETSPTGRTKTAPEAGASLSRLTFAYASCQQYEHGYFTAYRRMAEEDLDLVLHLGDYIYEYGPNEYVSPTGNVRDHSGPEIKTLEDYRNRHAQYRTDEDLQAAHAAFAWVVTWDDHEVDNNWADEEPEEISSDTKEEFLRRRAAGFKAYYEHMPLRKSSVPRGIDMRLYRRIAYGDLAEFNVFDTRQYRDDQAAKDGIKPPNPEQRDPSRTLTGEAQERWLFEGLSASRARWNILAQQVFFAERDFSPGAAESFSMDAWDGYLGSRDRITRFIAERGVRNPVVLTGDVHANWACNLKSDYDDPDSATIGTEYVATSITSGGDGSDQRADTAEILAENPHIEFFNDKRGYVRCTLTPDELRTDYRVVQYVTRPGSPVSTRASFVTADGDPGARQVSGEQTGRGLAAVSELTEQDRLEAQRIAGRRSRSRGR